MRAGLFAIAAVTAGVVLGTPARADAPSDPATGVWQVYSDKDGQPDGRIRTFVYEGKLVGVVDQLRPDAPRDSKCTHCTGKLKDKPILGMIILWGLEKDGDSWDGGTILDPQSGSTYRCHVKLASRDALEVRGYVGIPLLGRTQTWKRAQ
jgi:uncharacterized protein (DUF2147 family)